MADAPDATPLPRLSKEIAFEDVKFGYTGDRFILDGVSFTIGAGEAVAVVGQSGSGKSTILNLLTRFYDPTEGRVSIDGYDLQHVTQESLRAQIGIVFQDSVLFNTTVRENLRAGKPDATDAEIEAAAHAADLHAVIEALPFGYDTLVGERGGWLSGGQRQRVAIARAILRNPAILVLDEVTSALDAGTEAAIHDTLRRAARDRTVVLVTHRLALAAHLDQVVVLDQGRVAELGTHDELLERRGLYTRLWQLQGGFVISADGRYAEVVPRRLRAIPLFENVDDKTLEALAEQFVAEQYEAGEQIIAEGEPGERFYLIVRGKVAVTTTGTEGKTVHLAVLEDGDYFGEIALIEEGAQPATVHTRLPSIVLSLHRRHFMQMLQRNTALQKAIEQTALDRSLNLVTSRGRRARSSSSLQDLHSSD